MANKLYTTFGIALVYVLTAQLGLLLSLLPFWEVALLWPPSGIALAAVIIFGRIALPGIFLGALATYLIVLPATLSPTILGVVSVTIATTATLTPLAASTAMRRIISNGPREVTAAQLLASSFTNFLACSISTAGGITSLYLCGVIPQKILLIAGGMWWLGDFCGMMIFGPICWVVIRSLRSSRRRAARDPIATALIVNSAFVGAALLIFMTLWSFETGDISRLLQREAKLAANNVALTLKEAEHDVVILQNLVYASDNFNADEFRRYVSWEFRDTKRHIAQAVGWAPRVTNPETWENEVRDSSPVGIRLLERNDSGKLVPVAQREDYFPVQYIHPREGNQTAIGFDLGSEPSRRLALDHARDTGRASMVSPIVLVQSADAEPAMLIGVPIYRPEVSLDTVEARRANLTGFATAVYLIRELFTNSLKETAADLEFHLFERLHTDEVQWYHTIVSSHSANDINIAPEPAPTLASLEARPNGIAAVNFADHEWLVVVTPGATLIQDTRTWTPWAVMLLILALGIVSSSILLERISARRNVLIERRRTEEAFQEARAANDAMTFFMAAAGHDIKQPLYALGMLTDTLLMSDPKASSVPLLEQLRNSIDAMGEQFDELMHAGKLNRGRFEPALTQARLAGIIDPIGSEIALLCADKGLTWNLNVENALVVTDRLLLQRLLRNLLSNAVRYTNQGEVSCSAIARDNVVEFRISDTGSGIALRNQKEMFDEFVLRDDYKRDSTSTGLGLPIVDKINRVLDLGLQIASTPGVGTTFSFQIPRVPEE